MKILVLGNIGSGKTTLCKELSQQLPSFEYIAIDDFRRIHSDGTLKGDSKTKSLFVKNITHDDTFQIIECSGFGRLGSSVYRRMNKYKGKLLVVITLVDKEICLQRLKKRIWDVPFPQDIIRGNDLVVKLDKQFKTSFLHKRWASRSNTIFLQSPHHNLKDHKALITAIISLIKNDEVV